MEIFTLLGNPFKYNLNLKKKKRATDSSPNKLLRARNASSKRIHNRCNLLDSVGLVFSCISIDCLLSEDKLF